MTPERHKSVILGSMYKILMTIRMAVHYVDKSMMKKMITTIVWASVEYAAEK